MHIAVFLPAIIFGLAGLAVLLYLVSSLLRGFGFVLQIPRFSPSSLNHYWREGRLLKHKQKNLIKLEQRLFTEPFSLCRAELQEIFIFDYRSKSEGFFEQTLEHHLALLRILLKVADRQEARLINLPVVESLMQSRHQLSNSFLQASQKLKVKGQKMSWARAELQRKLREIQDRLATNEQSLQNELSRLFDQLDERIKAEQVTYH